MTGRLQREIGQTKPFRSLEVEAFLNVQRTAGALTRGVSELLRPHGLTHQQYNVLRILRGAGAGGLPCMEIGNRMVTRDPDVTRLLDRLAKAGLVERDRTEGDRRVVLARITGDGLDLLARLDAPVDGIHARQLGHLGERKLRLFVSLLEQARDQTTEGSDA